jgi:hypothetical protein
MKSEVTARLTSPHTNARRAAGSDKIFLEGGNKKGRAQK